MDDFDCTDKAQRAHNDLQGALIVLGARPTAELSSGALVLAARLHIKNTRPCESKQLWMDRCERMWNDCNAEEEASRAKSGEPNEALRLAVRLAEREVHVPEQYRTERKGDVDDGTA